MEWHFQLPPTEHSPEHWDLAHRQLHYMDQRTTTEQGWKKNLEDLMDRDWRLFRAKLVAQEEVETHIHDPHEHHEAHSHVHQAKARAKAKQNQLHDDRQMKQEKFGNIFAAIFHKTNEE
eukprot:1158297_1